MSNTEIVLAGLDAIDDHGPAAHDAAGGRAASPPYLVVILHCPSCQATSIPIRNGEIPAAKSLLEAALCDAAVEDATGRRRSVVPPRIRRLAMQRARFRCESPDCGLSRMLEIHHRVPLGGGGTHELENVAVLCWRCHRQLHEADESAAKDLREAPI